MKKFPMRRLYKAIVAALSFSSELRKMRREMNAKIDAPETFVQSVNSHARGVNRWFKRRRISIAESYLAVVSELDSKHCADRLEALRVFVDAALHSKSLDMPLNTARVQMALVKEAVKNRENKRRQLELLYDFSVSTYGQKQVILRLCDELNIVVLPEKGARLDNFAYGWDDHVHDTATTGRKNPTQLVIDAFIKGISSLTIAYGSAGDIEMMAEALEAGRIIGIRVSIALEFSMIVKGCRFHFMALLPRFGSGAEARAFFAEQSGPLAFLFEGLERNQESRTVSARRVLEDFNARELAAINEGFPDDPLYRLPPLTFEALSAFVPTVGINRILLAEFLHATLRPIMFNRLLLLKVRKSQAAADAARKRIRNSGRKAAEEAYARLKKEFRDMSAETVLKRYFDGPSLIEYQSVFDDPASVKAALALAGCTLKVLHPLEHGLEKAREMLGTCRGVVDVVEIYNNQDCVLRDPSEVLELARTVNAANISAAAAGTAGAVRFAPFIPVCGSDSTGRHPKIPGMGFIRADRILGGKRESFLARHMALPPLVSAMVSAGGEPVDESAAQAAPAVVCLGKGAESGIAMDDSASENADITMGRAWRYLNPAVKNGVFMAVGYLVADHYIGTAYALLWLGITGFRNSIADLVSSRGARLSEWKLRSINFDNVAQSLFWTGFSVPILGFVKEGFDSIWPWVQDGALFNVVKFFVISFANGLYLAAHNTLRGFDRKVVRANFFRSVIAWPFATLFAPLGNLLQIPSIVQTKIWSDVVAAFIEGSSKYRAVIRLRKNNLEEIIPRILDTRGEERDMAILDLLYLFREEPRTKSSLIALFELSKAPAIASLWMGKGAAPARPLADLAAVLASPALPEQLTDFVLSRYDEDMATDLVDLVSDMMPQLADWLESREPER